MSCFKGLGKVKPLKVLHKHPRFLSVFQRLGQNWTLLENDFLDLESFVCTLFGYPRIKSVNEVWFLKLKDKTKDIFDIENVDANMNVDMAKLPP